MVKSLILNERTFRYYRKTFSYPNTNRIINFKIHTFDCNEFEKHLHILVLIVVIVIIILRHTIEFIPFAILPTPPCTP